MKASLYWLYLGIAIVTEVIGTSALKSAEGFTRFWPSVLVVVSYALSFYLLSLTLKTIPVGVVYAVWSGVGMVLLAIIGAVFFKQMLDTPAMVGIGLILAGVVVINLFSHTSLD
ncbi:multidrug transporter [Halothiobacillus diazotrophicus]|uniref:Multidrug transporter n=1 Tax=Halothiobacillus diazotrophicus TaxID=1860122 RepID=A0A191ZHZ1_9GAMM|nr:multidrug efflux SMR transporter [Halothiobacillus diazotrophicus]ANJ67485.1 multidrug transporter [Halothiobacillus diazotrophicus]